MRKEAESDIYNDIFISPIPLFLYFFLNIYACNLRVYTHMYVYMYIYAYTEYKYMYILIL